MNFSLLAFGFFKIEVYGLFIALAFGVGVWNFYRLLQKKNLKPNLFAHYFWIWFLVSLFFGRLILLLMNPSIWWDYEGYSFFAFWEGGVYLYAVFLSFLGLAYWYLRDTENIFWRWLDNSVYPFLIAFLIVDLGAFLSGGIYGTPATIFGKNLPWGVKYETFSVDVLSAVHPVTIYLLILHGLLLLLLWKKSAKLQRRIGQRGLLMLIGFTFADFLTSFFRYYKYGIVAGINIHQVVFVVVFLFLTALYIRKFIRS